MQLSTGFTERKTQYQAGDRQLKCAHGQGGKVFFEKILPGSEAIIAQQSEAEGGDFFEKTAGKRSEAERRPCRATEAHSLPYRRAEAY